MSNIQSMLEQMPEGLHDKFDELIWNSFYELNNKPVLVLTIEKYGENREPIEFVSEGRSAEYVRANGRHMNVIDDYQALSKISLSISDYFNPYTLLHEVINRAQYLTHQINDRDASTASHDISLAMRNGKLLSVKTQNLLRDITNQQPSEAIDISK